MEIMLAYCRILEHSEETDRLVESDIQADNQQSFPYNTPEVFGESSHSHDSYVREIQETHYSELISHPPRISALPYSLPQSTVTVTTTSSGALCMPTSSTNSHFPTFSAVFRLHVQLLLKFLHLLLRHHFLKLKPN